MSTVVIVTGESSGELYGSLLAEELKQLKPDIHVMGVGGTRMREAGVEIISPISHAFGLIEAVSAYRKIREAFQKTVKAVNTKRPEVIVLIDYPDFNLKLAQKVKKTGVKILYYVSPQVWAWRKRRVNKIARLVDRMAVILPFEEKIYQDKGVQCEFVGHPVMEEIQAVLQAETEATPTVNHSLTREGIGEGLPITPDVRSHYKTLLGLDPEKSLLSLLPGSRPHELDRLMPVMLEAVRLFKSTFGDFQICIPLAPNTDTSRYGSSIDLLEKERVHIKKGESVQVLAASDLAVVASGTATLQAALLEVPMVVIYRLSPITFFLGKLIVDVKHISLVNILSENEVVRELLQNMANPEEILNELSRILNDVGYREAMIAQYREIKKQFSGKGPSKRVARIVAEMAGWK
jgi:lipid-A-disaccharide synthase